MKPGEALAWLREGPGDPMSAREILLSDAGDAAEGERSALVAALELATELHSGQVRADGTPYIVHPIRVALLARSIAAGVAAPTPVTVGALLHDTLEDTRATKADLTREFGREIADLVECLTAAPENGEGLGQRRDRKLAKWERVSRASLSTRLVHCSDVVDNLCALRFLDTNAEGGRKVPRWMMQAERFQRPIASSVSAVLEDAIDEEIALLRSRGFEPGSWEGD